MSTKKAIHFYGALAEFGERFDLNVKTPREAFHAIGCQFPRFRQIAQRVGRVWIVKENGEHSGFVQTSEVDFRSGDAWHFIPAVEGALPVIPILIAAAMTAISAAPLFATAAMTFAEIGFLAVSVASLAMSIYALVAGQPAKRAVSKRDDALQSYGFRDVPSLSTDGTVIPVLLGGPYWVKPLVIGSRIRTY